MVLRIRADLITIADFVLVIHLWHRMSPVQIDEICWEERNGIPFPRNAPSPVTELGVEHFSKILAASTWPCKIVRLVDDPTRSSQIYHCQSVYGRTQRMTSGSDC